MSAPNTVDAVNFIYDGVPATTLAEIFGLDHKEVNKRIAGRVEPVKSKDKYVRYRIRDVAPYLCEMKIDPEEMIKNISPSKLPPALQDAFWKAQLSRQKYQKERGDLWNTERVFKVVSDAFKVIRLTILMFVDTVEQRTQLSDEQRRIIQQLGDGLLESLEKAVRESFVGYEATENEHGTPLTESISLPSDEEEEEIEEVDPFA